MQNAYEFAYSAHILNSELSEGSIWFYYDVYFTLIFSGKLFRAVNFDQKKKNKFGI